jgi:hypothetical protein
MEFEKICFSSKAIDIAENDLYLEITNRLCYYDDKNLNNVMLPYKGFEESALENAKTLINMPVQAKYKKINNMDDLGSHEMHVLPTGEIEFLTESIGTHISIEIKDDTVTTVSGDTKTLPCLFAKCRIWKRNSNMIAAVKRLYESDGGLNSSWEISTSEYEYKAGVKILKDYAFLANTFLGSTTTPAYNGTSKAISLSSLSEDELLVAEALSLDLSENQTGTFDINNEPEKEENSLKKDKNVVLSSENSAEAVPTNTEDVSDAATDVTNAESATAEAKVKEDKKDVTDDNAPTETSALTSYDLRVRISKACRDKYDDWCWVAYLFPEEHEVWCEYDGESELDYLKFTYTVENDVVTVSEPVKVSLTVSVKDINTTISEYEKTIAEKDDLIVKASSTITSLKSENTELSQYKEKFTQMEQEKVAAELAQKKEDLIASVVKSGQITREEIEESEEFSGYVENLDKKSLMAIVGERLSASVDKKNEAEVETSETKNDVHVASNLNTDDEIVDGASIMRNFLRK